MMNPRDTLGSLLIVTAAALLLSPGNPTPYDGNVIVLAGSDQHAVMAFDSADGSVVWTSEPGSVSYAQATLTKLALRDQEDMLALDLSSGSK